MLISTRKSGKKKPGFVISLHERTRIEPKTGLLYIEHTENPHFLAEHLYGIMPEEKFIGKFGERIFKMVPFGELGLYKWRENSFLGVPLEYIEDYLHILIKENTEAEMSAAL